MITCLVIRSPKMKTCLVGVMKTQGFTLQIHDFCQKLIALLEEGGVVFHWNMELEEIVKNGKDEVIGLKVAGDMLRADHYVLSLGAYAGSALDNVLCKNKVHGVLGIWLFLPDVYQLNHSFKIHKDGHIGEDTNITLVEEAGQKKACPRIGIWLCRKNMKKNKIGLDELKPIYESLIRTAKTYYRAAYEEALSEGSLYENWKYCIRPFTPNGLGIFETLSNVGGGHTFITGGHNTGGFTQAPVVGQSIVDFLGNKKTTMEDVFHPSRTNLKNESIYY